MSTPWREATGISSRIKCEDVEEYLKASDVNTKQTPRKCPFQKGGMVSRISAEKALLKFVVLRCQICFRKI